MRKLLLVLGLTLLSFSVLYCIQSYAQERSVMKSITAQELQSGTKIIGYLGLPLGTVTTIKAKLVESNTKETTQLIEIAEVAGKRLDKPVLLDFSIWNWGNLDQKNLPVEKELALRVYEHGGMEGVPHQAMKETVYIQTVDYHFRTSVVILYQVAQDKK